MVANNGTKSMNSYPTVHGAMDTSANVLGLNKQCFNEIINPKSIGTTKTQKLMIKKYLYQFLNRIRSVCPGVGGFYILSGYCHRPREDKMEKKAESRLIII